MRSSGNKGACIECVQDYKVSKQQKSLKERIATLEAENERLKGELDHATLNARKFSTQVNALKRERDEERADELRLRDLRLRDYYVSYLRATESLAAERDAALGKLEEVRKACKGALKEQTTTAHSEGWDAACKSILAILDAPAPEGTEVVTRQVVWYRSGRHDKGQCTFVEYFNNGCEREEIARAQVTFHVKRETPKPPRVGESLKEARR